MRDLRLHCVIGIDPAEREAPQQVVLDIEIALARAAGEAADGVPRPAVDYAAVMRRMQEFAASKPHGLMEDFAAEAAGVIVSEFDAAEALVRCRKPRPFSNLGEAAAEATAYPRG